MFFVYIIDNNCYWDGGVNNILFRWGVTWKYNRKYSDLVKVADDLGFESNGKIINPEFGDRETYDLRINRKSELIKNNCYPQGEVPYVALGVMGN